MSTGAPWACSGDRYWAVPTTIDVPVRPDVVSVAARAMPKSITLMPPLAVTMMFAGLMSRCTMPDAWLCASAWSTTLVISRARRTGSGPESCRMLRRVVPSTSSITMKGTRTPVPGSVSSPLSKTAAMPGMIEDRDRVRLAAEPLVERGVRSQLGPQPLDRDLPVQTEVETATNLGHPPATKRLAQLVAVPEYGLILDGSDLSSQSPADSPARLTL